jgi:hypothetical protein
MLVVGASALSVMMMSERSDAPRDILGGPLCACEPQAASLRSLVVTAEKH